MAKTDEKFKIFNGNNKNQNKNLIKTAFL